MASTRKECPLCGTKLKRQGKGIYYCPECGEYWDEEDLD